LLESAPSAPVPAEAVPLAEPLADVPEELVELALPLVVVVLVNPAAAALAAAVN
jgi:hypothetical protein